MSNSAAQHDSSGCSNTLAATSGRVGDISAAKLERHPLPPRAMPMPKPPGSAGEEPLSTTAVPRFLAQAGPAHSIRRFGRKQTVFRQGEPSDAVFYILDGRIQLTVLSEHGKEGCIGMLAAGAFLGESCLLEGGGIGHRRSP